MQKDKVKKSFEEDGKDDVKKEEEVDELLDDDDDASALVDTGDDREMDPEDIEYEARPYESLGFTVGTPPPGMFKTEQEKTKEEEEAKKRIFQVCGLPSNTAS